MEHLSSVAMIFAQGAAVCGRFYRRLFRRVFNLERSGRSREFEIGLFRGEKHAPGAHRNNPSFVGSLQEEYQGGRGRAKWQLSSYAETKPLPPNPGTAETEELKLLRKRALEIGCSAEVQSRAIERYSERGMSACEALRKLIDDLERDRARWKFSG